VKKNGNLIHYVYILRSTIDSKQVYTGFSTDLQRRLDSHNSGANNHTSKYKPWKIVWYCGFSNKEKAQEFEKYLKTASGIAFKRKRLL